MSHHINPVLSGNLKYVKDYKGKFDLTQFLYAQHQGGIAQGFPVIIFQGGGTI